jgi:hypothetical protein
VTKAATVERLYDHTILQEYYGWKSHTRARLPGGQRFWPDEIGRTQYHQTMVTLSRATERLQRRGLVTRVSGTFAHWSGVTITDEGRRLAPAWLQTALSG